MTHGKRIEKIHMGRTRTFGTILEDRLAKDISAPPLERVNIVPSTLRGVDCCAYYSDVLSIINLRANNRLFASLPRTQP
jgi:hypothetical protein